MKSPNLMIWVLTTLGRRAYVGSLTKAQDPNGREYYWIGGGESKWWGSGESDFRAIHDGYISVTPLHLDLTNYKLLEEIGRETGLATRLDTSALGDGGAELSRTEEVERGPEHLHGAAVAAAAGCATRSRVSR